MSSSYSPEASRLRRPQRSHALPPSGTERSGRPARPPLPPQRTTPDRRRPARPLQSQSNKSARSMSRTRQIPPAAEPEESSFTQGLNSLWSKFSEMTVSARTSADSGTGETSKTSLDYPVSDSGEEQQGMWAMWNRLKEQIHIPGFEVNEDDSDPDEVSRSLRNYYATKGGPIPKFLEEQSATTTRQQDLDRFEQRQASLGRSRTPGRNNMNMRSPRRPVQNQSPQVKPLPPSGAPQYLQQHEYTPSQRPSRPHMQSQQRAYPSQGYESQFGRATYTSHPARNR